MIYYQTIDQLAAADKIKYPGEYTGDHNTMFVIDVSKHNGELDWKTIFLNPYIVGAVVKAGGGYWDDFEKNIDPKFIENCKAIIEAGKALGLYWYLYGVNNYDKLHGQIDDFERAIDFLDSFFPSIDIREHLILGIHLDWEDHNFYGVDGYPSGYWSNGHMKTMIESNEYDIYTSKSKFDQMTGNYKIKPYSGYGIRWLAQYYYGYKDLYLLTEANNYGKDILYFYSDFIDKPLILKSGKQDKYQIPQIPNAFIWENKNLFWDKWQLSEKGKLDNHPGKFDINIINKSHPAYNKLVLGKKEKPAIDPDVLRRIQRMIRRKLFYKPYPFM